MSLPLLDLVNRIKPTITSEETTSIMVPGISNFFHIAMPTAKRDTKYKKKHEIINKAMKRNKKLNNYCVFASFREKNYYRQARKFVILLLNLHISTCLSADFGG